ncbi:hypothetical protein SAMN04488601_1011465 [Paenibacillus sp. 453mf]|nr:hypothetical protein SAMN04488601_1011465 [Paenibacillus sp. 453mf]
MNRTFYDGKSDNYSVSGIQRVLFATMEGVKVSIDRIVVDFTNVFWDFFNPFQLRLRQYFNASFNVHEKGFKYHVHVRDGGHFLHISYQLTFVPKSRIFVFLPT